MRMTWKDYYQLTVESTNLPLSAGMRHLGVIDQKGQLYTWGNNRLGQLGNGTTISTNIPQMVLTNVLQVSCDFDTAGAVTKDGKVYTWGSNFRGGLGIGSCQKNGVLVPTLVSLPKKVIKIDIGYSGSIVLTEDGEVYVWGLLTRELFTMVPIKLNLPKEDDKVVNVATGSRSYSAVTKTGKLYMWGDNLNYLYLSKNWRNIPSGIYTPDDPKHRKFINPTLVPFLEPIHQISMGNGHLGVVTKKGELWMVGNNYSHQIGEYTPNKKDSDRLKRAAKESYRFFEEDAIPLLILIKMPTSVLYFNTRWDASLVKLKDGRVLMWGRNGYHQIDSSKSDNIKNPVEIILDRPIVYIVPGGEFTAAITDDDYINLWGKQYPSV